MRRLRYGVAMSEYDWIVSDPSIDFAAMFALYDTFLMGRKTYEVASEKGKSWDRSGQRWIVVSTTMKPEEHPSVTVLNGDVPHKVAALKEQPGKDIWLFVLFRTLLDAGLVDAMDIAVMPVMIGSGVPLLPAGQRRNLHLETCKTLPSGILMLSYSIV